MKLISAKEVASELGLNPETVRRMARRGQIPYVKISATHFKYDLENVIKALNENQKGK